MDDELRNTLLQVAVERLDDEDPSHDSHHANRVLQNAELIMEEEGGDPDVVVPAALLHDVVNPPKDHPDAEHAAERSAETVRDILTDLDGFPDEKIDAVCDAVRSHSYTHPPEPASLEAEIVWDADKLESTGAVSVMRTFSSTGRMSRQFYDPDDPFAENRELDPEQYALDLVPFRLLQVEDQLHTETAQEMARERTRFLEQFLNQVRDELPDA